MDFFSFFKSKKNNASKNQAKQRLQLVLLHERADSSTDFLDKLKGELLDVIKKYIEIDENEFDISLTKTKSEDGTALVPALVANIPFNKVK